MVWEEIESARMKKILFVIFGMLLLCAGGFVFLANSHFNPPSSIFQVKAVNPKWAILMLSATISAIMGVVLIIKAIEKK